MNNKPQSVKYVVVANKNFKENLEGRLKICSEMSTELSGLTYSRKTIV